MERYRTELLFYDLLAESNDINELNDTVDFFLDCMRVAIIDLCSDKEWDYSDLDNELM